MKYIFSLYLLLGSVLISAQDLFSPDAALFTSFAKDNNSTLFSENSKVPVTPASVLKILTTSTALEVLGPDYRYKTRVGYKGEISNGILNGDLIIISGNDPTLGSNFFDSTHVSIVFDQIESALAEKNIQIVKGDIQIQHNNFEVAYPAARLWEDMGNYYGGIPRNINYKDNTIRITLKSEELGNAVKVVRVDPSIDFYNIESKVIAAGHNKDSAYVYGIRQIQKWWIEGSIPSHKKSFVIKSAMPDPSMVLVSELKSYLLSKGVLFRENYEERTDQFSSFQLLSEVYSPPLSEIIKVTNHKSNNLFADQLFLTLGEQCCGEKSWDNGVLAITNFWKDKINFSNNFKIADGSGLSPKNLVTTEAMVELLAWMQNNSSHFDVFLESLAIGGQSGTLKTIFKDAVLNGKVFGKSGSMESVIAYCGYYKKADDMYVPFCVVANHYLVQTKVVRRYIDKYLSSEFSK